MNKMLLLALAVMFGTLSCITQRKCLERYPPSTDSVYIEKLKEVPIYIEGDTITVKVPVNCPDQDVATYENVKLRQTIRILNGKLLSSTELKPDTVKVYVPEIHSTVVKVPEPVKYIPKIYKDAMIICIVIFALVFVFLGWKAYKMFVK